jgi:hypothetical protein
MLTLNAEPSMPWLGFSGLSGMVGIVTGSVGQQIEPERPGFAIDLEARDSGSIHGSAARMERSETHAVTASTRSIGERGGQPGPIGNTVFLRSKVPIVPGTLENRLRG